MRIGKAETACGPHRTGCRGPWGWGGSLGTGKALRGQEETLTREGSQLNRKKREKLGSGYPRPECSFLVT